jgi:copper chaperone
VKKFASLTLVLAMATVLVAVGVAFACGNKEGSAKTASAQMVGAKVCPSTKNVETTSAMVKNTGQSIMLNVTGMTCQGCVTSITKSLAAVDGVSDVLVSLEDGTAKVAYDANKVKSEALTAAVVKAGYKAELAQVDNKKMDEMVENAGTGKATCSKAKKCDPAACPLGKMGSK